MLERQTRHQPFFAGSISCIEVLFPTNQEQKTCTCDQLRLFPTVLLSHLWDNNENCMKSICREHIVLLGVVLGWVESTAGVRISVSRLWMRWDFVAPLHGEARRRPVLRDKRQRRVVRWKTGWPGHLHGTTHKLKYSCLVMQSELFAGNSAKRAWLLFVLASKSTLGIDNTDLKRVVYCWHANSSYTKRKLPTRQYTPLHFKELNQTRKTISYDATVHVTSQTSDKTQAVIMRTFHSWTVWTCQERGVGVGF